MPGGSPGKNLRAKSILGEEDFAERIKDYINGKEHITDIPKSKRFTARSPLHRLFGENELRSDEGSATNYFGNNYEK
ncbi:MAG: hypothetical protein PHN75_03105 [Syntrophales bacterium]|nr:hypothetical protein [Syntrophales bacterium]